MCGKDSAKQNNTKSKTAFYILAVILLLFIGIAVSGATAKYSYEFSTDLSLFVKSPDHSMLIQKAECSEDTNAVFLSFEKCTLDSTLSLPSVDSAGIIELTFYNNTTVPLYFLNVIPESYSNDDIQYYLDIEDALCLQPGDTTSASLVFCHSDDFIAENPGLENDSVSSTLHFLFGYKFTFNLNYDAENPVYDIVYDATGDIDIGDAPVRKGYAFTGWYDDADCSLEHRVFDEHNRVIDMDYFQDADSRITLYGGWKANKYQLILANDVIEDWVLEIPDGYEPCEYIESDRSQYIDTAYYIKSGEVEITAKVYSEPSSGEKDLIGNQTGNQQGRFVLGYYNFGLFAYNRFESARDENVVSGNINNEIQNIICRYSLSKLQKELTNNGRTATMEQTQTIANNIKTVKIFCDGNNDMFLAAKLYYLSLNDDGNTVLDLYPVKESSSGAFGLYNLASGDFLTAAQGNPLSGRALDIRFFDVNYDEDFILPKYTKRLPGYKFVGWGTDFADDIVTYTDGETVRNIVDADESAVKLYPKFIDATIVTFNVPETGYRVEMDLISSDAVSIDSKYTDVEGKTFAGWADISGNMYYDSEGQLLRDFPDEDIQLYAVYTVELPERYKQLKYITCNGKQSIDTGHYQTTDYARILTRIETAAANSEEDIIGNQDGKNRFVMGFYQKYVFAYSCQNSSNDGNIETSKYPERHMFYIDSVYDLSKKIKTLSVDGTYYEHMMNATIHNSNTSVKLFENGSGANKLNANVYYLKYTDGDELVNDFVPVYDTIDNAAGLFDLTSLTDNSKKEFYPSSTATPFVAGPYWDE